MTSGYEAKWRQRRRELEAEAASLGAEEVQFTDRWRAMRKRQDEVRAELQVAGLKLQPLEVFQHTVMEEVVSGIPLQDLRNLVRAYAEDVDELLRLEYFDSPLQAKVQADHTSASATKRPLRNHRDPFEWTVSLTEWTQGYHGDDVSSHGYRLSFFLARDGVGGKEGQLIELFRRDERTSNRLKFRGRVDRAASRIELTEVSHDWQGPVETKRGWTVEDLGSFRLGLASGHCCDVTIT